jgi:hypothetical protein
MRIRTRCHPGHVSGPGDCVQDIDESAPLSRREGHGLAPRIAEDHVPARDRPTRALLHLVVRMARGDTDHGLASGDRDARVATARRAASGAATRHGGGGPSTPTAPSVAVRAARTRRVPSPNDPRRDAFDQAGASRWPVPHAERGPGGEHCSRRVRPTSGRPRICRMTDVPIGNGEVGS